MKLVDKMILLTRMLRDNRQNVLDVDHQINTQKDYFSNQSKYFKDKTNYQELDLVLNQMSNLKKRYDELVKIIDKNTNDLLRKEEVEILKRDYNTHAITEPDLKLMNQRISALDPELVNLLSKEIGNYSDWRWAGVELNPSNGFLTRAFLACDPLYLYTGNVIDEKSLENKFNSFFHKKRLMSYNNLANLPRNQLGLAVSINSYEFWPIDPIKEEMQQVYFLLKPGGHFIFTYNDCEHLASLDLCANDYRAYNTKTLMTNMVKMLGFDIVKESSVANGAHSYIIAKKHGTLNSQKLSSPLIAVKSPKLTELQKVQYNSDHERYKKK